MQFTRVCQNILYSRSGWVLLWFQVCTVGFLGNESCSGQDGSLCEEDITGGAEVQETEEEGNHLNISREQHKYVLLMSNKVIMY